MRRSALLSLCLAAAMTWVSCATSADEVGRKEAELEQLRARIERVREELEAAEGRKGGLVTQLRGIERQIGKVDRALRQTRTSLEQTRKRLRTLEGRRGQQEKQLADQRKALAQQIRASFIMGRQEQVKLLLNQEDPARVHRTFVYYDYMHRARTKVIESAIAKLEELRATESAIRDEKHELDALLARRQRERTALEGSRHEREGILKGLNHQISSQGRELEELQTSAKRLQRLLESLQDALADIPDDAEATRSFRASRGQHPWPVQGRVQRLYGSLRPGSDLHWTGVRIEAPAGREIRAVAAGRVAFADWLRGMGLLIIIDHGEGYMSLYGHNQALYRETGEWVGRGDVIASVGNSGGQARPALYFEIRRNGKPQNPSAWCRDSARFARN
jgi:septal ring factor EnvC (AmiA/AmiB activator)